MISNAQVMRLAFGYGGRGRARECPLHCLCERVPTVRRCCVDLWSSVLRPACPACVERLSEFSSHGLPDKWYPAGEAYISHISADARELSRRASPWGNLKTFSSWRTFRHQSSSSCRQKNMDRKRATDCTVANGMERDHLTSSLFHSAPGPLVPCGPPMRARQGPSLWG